MEQLNEPPSLHRSHQRPSLFAIALLTLLPAVFFFVAVDYAASYLILRHAAPTKLPQVEYIEFDPLQMWRLRRGYDSGDIRISQDGFRSDVPISSQAGKKLVFVIGGSTVFGAGARPDQTITHFLQQLAHQFQIDQDLVFVNAGVTGYYSTQELIHVERNVLPYRPYMVISLSGRNDAFYGLHPDYESDAIPYHGQLRQELGALDPYYTPREAPRPPLHIVLWLASKLARRKFNWLHDFEASRLRLNPSALDVFLRNQRSVHALLQGLGVRHVLFLQPTVNFPNRALAPEEKGMDQDYYVAPLRHAYETLSSAAEESLPEEWFRGMIDISRSSGQLFIDNTHLSENGARLVAQQIYRAIWGNWQLSHIDLATDKHAAVLGGGWGSQEKGYRWTSDRSAVTLDCPESHSAHMLVVAGVSAVRASRFTILANDTSVLETDLTPNQPFAVTAKLSAAVCSAPVNVNLHMTVSPALLSKQAGIGDVARPGLRIQKIEIR